MGGYSDASTPWIKNYEFIGLDLPELRIRLVSPVTMLFRNHAREVLKSGQKPCAGIWQMLPGSELSRCFANAGYDWVMLDMEHGMFDGRADVYEILQVFGSCVFAHLSILQC